MNDRFLIDFGEPTNEIFKKALVFDTNIWLIINGPYSDPKDSRLRKYSSFYAAALKSDAAIYLPQMVASEFINRAIRWQASVSDWNGQGKIHRHPSYPQWLKDASDDLYHIIVSCRLCDDGFSSTDMDTCLKRAGQSSIDFNDIFLSEVCKKNDFILVTDDADYKYQPIDLCSANKRILDV